MSAEPQSIRGYRLERKLGEGGMGVVYAATRDGVDYAVKVLRQTLCRDSTVLHRFRREAFVLMRLAHPCIVPVLEASEDQGLYYLVMPRVRHPTLQACLASPGLAPMLLLPAISCVLEALEEVHRLEVIHRDLTPANIFVTGAGCSAKPGAGRDSDRTASGAGAAGVEGLLTDFGLVKVLGSESALTQSGAMMGTVPYMAPEQLAAEAVSIRTDLYQVGLVLYRIVAGRLPFGSSLPEAVRAKCVAPALPDPRSLGAPISEAIARVILRATEREPARRHASAAEMAAELRQAGC